MELAFDILSWICLGVASAFAVAGGIGILELPDFYSRRHGGGITNTMGAGLVMVGQVKCCRLSKLALCR